MVVGYGLGALQNGARSKGKVDLLSGIVQRIVGPVAHGLASVANGWDDLRGGVFRGPKLVRENRELRAQLAEHAQDAQLVTQLQARIDDLRRLAGYRELPGRVAVSAQVVGFFPFANRIDLNVGSDQGVRPNMAVVAPKGLFGIVQTVSRDRCQAQLITSPTTRIGAKAVRNPPTAGLLHGETPSRLIVEFLDPTSPVAVDDLVVTSGYSDSIPENIPIGKIVQLDDNPDFGTRRAVVFPLVSVGEVRDVVVLK